MTYAIHSRANPHRFDTITEVETVRLRLSRPFSWSLEPRPSCPGPAFTVRDLARGVLT